MFRKNYSFLARLPEVSANSNEHYIVITSRILLIFVEISGNVKFPENLQPQEQADVHLHLWMSCNNLIEQSISAVYTKQTFKHSTVNCPKVRNGLWNRCIFFTFSVLSLPRRYCVMSSTLSVCPCTELHKKFSIAIFTKPCRIMNCCCGKNPFNFWPIIFKMAKRQPFIISIEFI